MSHSGRAQDQEVKIRSNLLVQELVDLFQLARPQVLDIAEVIKASTQEQQKEKRGHKRKLEDREVDEGKVYVGTDTDGRRTRSQCRAQAATSDLAADRKSSGSQERELMPNDGLLACPICNERMKADAVFLHLDVHNKPENGSGGPPLLVKYANHANCFTHSLLTWWRRSPYVNDIDSTARPPSKGMERLPQLNYSLMRDNALRKKLSEIGIPNAGPRALLVRRHTEWINLVNANCDSAKPRSKRDLLHELEIWEKTQGRQIANSLNGGSATSSVMNKNFNGPAWAARHDDDFQALIARARRNSISNFKPIDGLNEADGAAPIPEHGRLDVVEKNPTEITQGRCVNGHATSDPSASPSAHPGMTSKETATKTPEKDDR
ncbi:E3 ubiquitin-protein ligase rad18 [Lecanora helva]